MPVERCGTPYYNRKFYADRAKAEAEQVTGSPSSSADGGMNDMIFSFDFRVSRPEEREATPVLKGISKLMEAFTKLAANLRNGLSSHRLSDAGSMKSEAGEAIDSPPLPQDDEKLFSVYSYTGTTEPVESATVAWFTSDRTAALDELLAVGHEDLVKVFFSDLAAHSHEPLAADSTKAGSHPARDSPSLPKDKDAHVRSSMAPPISMEDTTGMLDLRAGVVVDVIIAGDIDGVRTSARPSHVPSQDPPMPATLQDNAAYSPIRITAPMIVVVVLILVKATSYVSTYWADFRRRKEIEDTFRQRIGTAWNLQQCQDAYEDRNQALRACKTFNSRLVNRLAGFVTIAGSILLMSQFSVLPPVACSVLCVAVFSVLGALGLCVFMLFPCPALLVKPRVEKMSGSREAPPREDRHLPALASCMMPAFVWIKDTFAALKQKMRTEPKELFECPPLTEKLEPLEPLERFPQPTQILLVKAPSCCLILQTLCVSVSRACTPALSPYNYSGQEQSEKMVDMLLNFFLLLAGSAITIFCERPVWSWYRRLFMTLDDQFDEAEKGDSDSEPIIDEFLYKLSVIWRLVVLDLGMSWYTSTMPIIGTFIRFCYQHVQAYPLSWLVVGLCLLLPTLYEAGLYVRDLEEPGESQAVASVSVMVETKKIAGARVEAQDVAVEAQATTGMETELAAAMAADSNTDDEWADVKELQAEAEVAEWELVPQSETS
ncbi:hypothetical protein BST61_g5861 [Cercospora zeina]